MLLTVFTPTYNRAHTLPKLYDSLCRQTCKDFKWLIVDDGSSDNTETIISSWRFENRIDITYVRQDNGGKMSAHNKGVEMCDTDFFFCVDSDDFLDDKGVETIIHNLPHCSEDWVCGLVAYRLMKHEDSYRILARFPHPYGYSTLSDLYRQGFRGETSLVFKTHVLREFPFPIVEGEKFITEAYVYNQIDKVYKLYLVDMGLIYCEYMQDGYTHNDLSLKLKYPMGWCLYYYQKKCTETDSRVRRGYEAKSYSYYLMCRNRQYAKKMHVDFGGIEVKIRGYLIYILRRFKYRKEIRLLDSS